MPRYKLEWIQDYEGQALPGEIRFGAASDETATAFCQRFIQNMPRRALQWTLLRETQNGYELMLKHHVK